MSVNAREAGDEMDALIQYCARYDPSFATAAVGVSDQDLARLEALAGTRLPPEYVAFQRRFGRTASGALGSFLADTEFGVDAAVNYYEQSVEPRSDRAVFLWTVDRQFNAFLSLDAIDGFRPIVELSWPFSDETGEFVDGAPSVTTVARSMMQFLYREAFTEVRLPSLEYHARLRENVRGAKPGASDTDDRRRRYREIAQRLEFQQVPFVEGSTLFFDRWDAALGLIGESHAPDSLYVAASTETELHRLTEVLSDNLDFLPWS